MTTITFIGAGSTVFTRNIAGDILNREALSGATIRLMDIDPKRLAESEAVVGRMVRVLDVPARVETHDDQRDGARRRGFRRRLLPDRRLRSLHHHRFRGAQALRPAPDHRRHARDRRHHAGSADGPASLVDLRGHAGGLPGRDHAAIRQPDGDQHLGDRREVSRDPPGRPLPFGAGHGGGAGPRSRRAGGRAALPRGRHQPHGVLSELRAPDARRDASRPLSRAQARLRGGPISQGSEPQSALSQQSALRDALAAGIFRHREQRAFRGIHALFHQARPPGPDRTLRHSSRRVPETLRRADRAVGEGGRPAPGRQRVERAAEPGIRGDDHERGPHRRAGGDLRQHPRTRASSRSCRKAAPSRCR